MAERQKRSETRLLELLGVVQVFHNLTELDLAAPGAFTPWALGLLGVLFGFRVEG